MKHFIVISLAAVLFLGGCGLNGIHLLSYQSSRRTVPVLASSEPESSIAVPIPIPVSEQLSSLAALANLSPEIRALVIEAIVEFFKAFPDIIQATQEPILEAIRRKAWFEEEHVISVFRLMFSRTIKEDK